MTATQIILLVLGGWLTASVLATVAWGSMSWFFGTRDCNRPALIAAQRELEARRHEFVTTCMDRYPR